MKNLIRAPIAAIFIVAVVLVIALPQSVTLNSNSNALVLQTQTQTTVLAARGDVIKEKASSALYPSNVTITTLTYMPSTTIEKTGENAELSLNSAMLEQDIGQTVMTQVNSVTTTATTITADFYTDVGFVSENNNGNCAINDQTMTTNADNTGAATLQTCGTNDAATTTITGTANIRGATLTLTVDRETYAIASRTTLVLRV